MDKGLHIEHADLDELMYSLGWLQAISVCLIVLGLLSMYAPYYSSFRIENIIGGIFLVSGLMFATHAFRTWKSRKLVAEMLIGILYLVFGALLLANLTEGATAVALFAGLFLILKGFLKIIYAARLRKEQNWEWVMASGIVSLLTGTIISAGFPEVALQLSGVLVGLDLIFSGLSVFMLIHKARVALVRDRVSCIGDVCFSG